MKYTLLIVYMYYFFSGKALQAIAFWVVASVAVGGASFAFAQNFSDHGKIFSSPSTLSQFLNRENLANNLSTQPNSTPKNLSDALKANRLIINKNFLRSGERYIELPKMRQKEIVDFAADVFSELESNSNYKITSIRLDDISVPNDKVVLLGKVERISGEKIDVIYFGHLQRERFTPRLWVYGVSAQAGVLSPNPDASASNLDPVIKRIFEFTSRYKANLHLTDLTSKVINLSYADADGALFALRAMGFSVITDEYPLTNDDSYKGELNLMGAASGGGLPMNSSDTSKKTTSGLINSSTPINNASPGVTGAPVPGDSAGVLTSSAGVGNLNRSFYDKSMLAIRNLPTSVNYSRLPLIVKMPPPAPDSMGLISNAPYSGGGSGGFGGLGSGVASITSNSMNSNQPSQLTSAVAAGTASQIMVLYHPRDFDQFMRVKKAIDETIDKPARQVYVEGMIIEIMENKMSELGIQFSNNGINRGRGQLTLGALGQLNTGELTPAAGYVYDSTSSIAKQFIAKINALVTTQEAQILSRPSILTLDNRQAMIRIGTDIPVASSSALPNTHSGSSFSVNFNYQQTGILLNIRPRISEDGKEISMLIDAVVSEMLDGEDVRITNSDGATLASAPKVGTRKIQTYARIKNNSPLIIGGLLNNNSIKSQSKVPLLGDLPVLGNLFGYTAKGKEKTEVVIVLTPSILNEGLNSQKTIAQSIQSGDRVIDGAVSPENYRISSEDLHVADDLLLNKRFMNYQRIADHLLAVSPETRGVKSINALGGGKIPGESILVVGMLKEFLEKLKIHESLRVENLLFPETRRIINTSQSMRSLADVLRDLTGEESLQQFFIKNPEKAIALQFDNSRSAAIASVGATRSLATAKIINCPDRKLCDKISADINQSTQNGVNNQFTILLQSEADLNRLNLAVLADEVISENGSESAFTLSNFRPGKLLRVKKIQPNRKFMLNANVARYFSYGNNFHTEFIKAIENALNEFEDEISKSEYLTILNDTPLDLHDSKS